MLKTDRNEFVKRSSTLMRRFARDEDGGIIVLTLLLLFTMLVMAGMAVDFMRFESERAELQSVSDRAVLSAAVPGQSQSAEVILDDFFEASGFDSSRISYVPGEARDGFREVEIQSSIDMNTFYLRLVGIDELEVPASSGALERIGKVEISMVLDISGTMRFSPDENGRNRFENMQIAAKSFAAEVLKPDNGGTVSLTIVPYAGSTNPGPEMFDYLNGVRYNNYRQTLEDDYGGTDGAGTPPPEDEFVNESSCLEFAAADWTNDRFPGDGRDQVAHFMYFPIAASVMDWGWCPHDRSAIRYAIKDYCIAADFIDGIRMHDGTGTHYGMKYGLAALSDDSQAAFAHLSTQPIDPSHPNWVSAADCAAYNAAAAADALADTDGEDDYGYGSASTELPTTLVSTDFSNRPAAWDDGETTKIIILMTDGNITSQYRPIDILDLRNEDEHIRRRTPSRSNTITNRGTNLNNFYAMCDFAKDPSRNVQVFTIAFEANSSGQTEMRNCASEPSMFFPVAGDEIVDRFKEIAGRISDLRLSQ